MRTGDEYQEYSEPKFAKPSRKSHKWLVLEKSFDGSKSRCKRCGMVRITNANRKSARFPQSQYFRGNLVSQGSVPECSGAAKACEPK